MAEKRGGRRSTTWGPGQGGRKPNPPELQEIKALAQSLSPMCIERLQFWAKSNQSAASTRACEVLLDRAFGKALQKQELTGANGGPIQTQQVDDTRPSLMDVLARAKGDAPKDTRH